VVSDTGFSPPVSLCVRKSLNVRNAITLGGADPLPISPGITVGVTLGWDDGILLRRPTLRETHSEPSQYRHAQGVCELVGGGRRGKDAACTPLSAVLGAVRILDGTAMFVANRLCKQAAHAWNTLQAQALHLRVCGSVARAERPGARPQQRREFLSRRDRHPRARRGHCGEGGGADMAVCPRDTPRHPARCTSQLQSREALLDGSLLWSV
jgi:hypothetical protein